MKNMLWLTALAVVVPTRADEAADRSQIGQTIAALNTLPPPPGLFADNADASVLDQLWSGKIPQLILAGGVTPALDGPLTVIISHEPWGEARIGAPLPAIEALNPRFLSGKVQFVSADVALADGEFQYTDEQGTAQITPLLFVMKREGAAWKIAAARRVAPASRD